jgi:tetratricopeptide (TPR) repeat protein
LLKLRWRIYNKAGKHGNALAVAERLTRLLPAEPEVFIWRSHSARWMQDGGAEQALQLLLDVANDFPDETAVPFDLARYNCALGKLAEARNWLRIAFEMAERNGTAKEWKMRAIGDKDLEPLWDEIRGH